MDRREGESRPKVVPPPAGVKGLELTRPVALETARIIVGVTARLGLGLQCGWGWGYSAVGIGVTLSATVTVGRLHEDEG